MGQGGFMVRLAILAAAFLAVGAQQSIEPPPSAGQCLHGSSERAGERARREQALKMARQINLAEMNARFGFRPLEELANVSPAPPGFKISLMTDTRSYSFSLKDLRDPCHYGIFSDHDRWIYEATPTQAATIVPVTH
jgi:hypothetical protein